MGNRRILIAFIPVLHEGYRKLFCQAKANTLYLVSANSLPEFSYLRKEIRNLEHDYLVKAIKSWGYFRRIEILEQSSFEKIRERAEMIVMPKDDLSEELAKLFPGTKKEFIPIFLRWDRKNSVEEKPVNYDRKVSFEGMVAEMMGIAMKEVEKASCWWRQVGAVIVKDNKLLLVSHNHHVPSKYMPYIEGDPRNCFKRGVNIEISTDFHAEASLISEAARYGIPIDGADLFVTTFPCPPCAKVIAYSGIKRCYFLSGYTMVDGERILHDKNVEIIFVEK